MTARLIPARGTVEFIVFRAGRHGNASPNTGSFGQTVFTDMPTPLRVGTAQ
jgi:hypothetical protein